MSTKFQQAVDAVKDRNVDIFTAVVEAFGSHDRQNKELAQIYAALKVEAESRLPKRLAGREAPVHEWMAGKTALEQIDLLASAKARMDCESR